MPFIVILAEKESIKKLNMLSLFFSDILTMQPLVMIKKTQTKFVYPIFLNFGFYKGMYMI